MFESFRNRNILVGIKNKHEWDEQTYSWKWTYGWNRVNNDKDILIAAKITDG